MTNTSGGLRPAFLLRRIGRYLDELLQVMVDSLLGIVGKPNDVGEMCDDAAAPA